MNSNESRRKFGIWDVEGIMSFLLFAFILVSVASAISISVYINSGTGNTIHLPFGLKVWIIATGFLFPTFFLTNSIYWLLHDSKKLGLLMVLLSLFFFTALSIPTGNIAIQCYKHFKNYNSAMLIQDGLSGLSVSKVVAVGIFVLFCGLFTLILFYKGKDMLLSKVNESKNIKPFKDEKVFMQAAPSSMQPIRKYRQVFTRTTGVFKRKRERALDLDELGLSYYSKQDMFSSMYLVLDKIVIKERTLQVEVLLKRLPDKPFKINVLEFDGDAWTNFNLIKNLLLRFAPEAGVEVIVER